MTRDEELAFRWADGSLTGPERAELEARGGDPEGARRIAAALEVEAALRGERILPPLGPAVLEDLRRRREDRVERAVMERVRAARLPRERRRSPVPWLAAAAALLAAATFFTSMPVGRAGFARVVEGAEAGYLHRGEGALLLRPGILLREGDRLRTESLLGQDWGRRVVVEYLGEPTRVTIEPLSDVTFRAGPGGKRIEVSQGEVSADVAPQREGPLVLVAPHARAEVLGTRLTLSAAPDATRLEVAEGRVRLTREADGATVEVPARHYSVAESRTELVARPVPEPPLTPPAIAGFSLIQLDAPRATVPGYEDLQDGAVIPLRRLPTRRVNLQANTDPERVGSVRWSWAGRSNFNTELVWPYTLVPNDGYGKQTWEPKPGLHTVTVTPFSGSYGNGLQGRSRSLTFLVVEE
jgi:hypothetical protein